MADPQQDEIKQPELNFTFDESVSEWNVPGPQWLRDHEKSWDGCATGALVFDHQDRILLVQRAAHDSMPNLWEVPGGAVDDDDPSILHGCARELWEEAGLVPRHIKHVIPDGFNGKPGAVFTNRTGKIFFCKFSFEVDVAPGQEVRLDANEHQDFVWATADEVKKEAIGDRKIPLANAIIRKVVGEGIRIHFAAKTVTEAA
ncbi:NUDIX hydrolase domain-like protein [Thelonectria olida]|uniref:NUDIX hydrolase domain-like protein n=1 Tax=Thelonectria olida TaxID=1576542 RepID=A0A9P8WA31_9HYPO|nr:NUDIX hydrolase domain-like protein [Thelonectria olida]